MAVLKEHDASSAAMAIESGPMWLLSVASLPKASIVIESRKGDAGGREPDLLLYRGALEVVPVDQDQAEIARAAWRRFGKGRHPAALNFGDCFAYALAMSRQVPLLFCGAGFARTDVAAVLGNNGNRV